MATMYVT